MGTLHNRGICALLTLLVHDVAMAVLAGIGGYKIAIHLRNKDRR
jgi:hypothetical protein